MNATQKLSVTLAGLSLALVACGGSSGPTAAECADPETTLTLADCRDVVLDVYADQQGGTHPGEETPFSGPATEPVEYPSGITATLLSVERRAYYSPDQPTHETLVTVTVELAADQPYPLETGMDSGPSGDLLYGPNRVASQPWHVPQDQAAMVRPGSPVVVVEEFSLPSEGLDELVYVWSPGPGEPAYTFNDLQDFLRG